MRAPLYLKMAISFDAVITLCSFLAICSANSKTDSGSTFSSRGQSSPYSHFPQFFYLPIRASRLRLRDSDRLLNSSLNLHFLFPRSSSVLHNLEPGTETR